jgi:hypothetical protein
MKQIILEPRPQPVLLGSVCAGRLLFVWGLYGCAMAMLWRLAAGNPWAQAATWLVALAAAGALMLAMEPA